MTAAATILIPVWNRADLLRKLLGTITEQTCVPREVIVIDNGSTDDAARVAGKCGARVIELGTNRGFAVAVNRGIEESKTEWIAVVNSDVELRAEWLERLVRAATETNAWFATGKTLAASDPARLDGTWDLVAKSACPWRAGCGARDSEPFSRRRTIAMSSATAALYRSELFKRIGNFFEGYESYLEDVDLSLRCAAEGLQGVYEPGAICTHHGSASTERWSPKSTYLISRNQELLIQRQFSPTMRRDWRWKIAVGHLLWGLLAMRHGRVTSWIQGKLDARRMANPPAMESPKLRAAIACAEREIFGMQQGIATDWYWRLYFLITGSESQ